MQGTFSEVELSVGTYSPVRKERGDKIRRVDFLIKSFSSRTGVLWVASHTVSGRDNQIAAAGINRSAEVLRRSSDVDAHPIDPNRQDISIHAVVVRRSFHFLPSRKGWVRVTARREIAMV